MSEGFARAAGLLVGLIFLVTGSTALLVLYFVPSFSVLALLAYSFGCRHGVDADHIAAIDNVTRRLAGTAGRRTLLVGVWFSLGHCTVVVLLCAAVIVGARTSSQQFEVLEELGAAVGPWVAAVVLLTIGSMNLCAARELRLQWRQREARGHAHELASLLTRCCPALMEAIDRPSRVFWIGLLFGLGLDTAAEIALLTSTAIAQPEVPPACALVLPLLFAAGMALVDSLNAVLMLWAQEWAADEGPMHRLFFSLFLTAASAVLGLGIGLIEALGQLASMPWLREHGPHALDPLWQAAEWLSDHLELLGMGAVGAFLAATAAAVVLAPRVVISRAACEEEALFDKLRESLLVKLLERAADEGSDGARQVLESRQAGADTFDHTHGHQMLQLDPVEGLLEAMKAGDRHARIGEWSAALGRYHKAIGLLTTSSDPKLVAQAHAAASIAQRKLGSMRSALRHADLAVAACDADACTHATRGAVLEALGLVVDAHAAFVEAAHLQPSQQTHAEAATRLLLLRCLLARTAAEGGNGQLEPAAATLTAQQTRFVNALRDAATARQLWPRLLPLPTPACVLESEELNSSASRLCQQRLMALLAVDVAVEAARSAYGGHNACAGMREWLLRKASELGLDVVGELVRAALEVDDEGASGSGESDEDDEEVRMVNTEVDVPGAIGRVLVQFELVPQRQRLTFSLISLDLSAVNLGEATLRYTFAVGLTCAYLLDAESLAHDLPYFEFAEWRSAERGALSPPEGLPRAPAVEQRAKVFVDFFSRGEGAHPPLAPLGERRT